MAPAEEAVAYVAITKEEADAEARPGASRSGAVQSSSTEQPYIEKQPTILRPRHHRAVVLRYRIFLEQKRYAPTTINLRLALAAGDEKWEVAVLGRNLTDEKIVTYANDTPLAFSQFGSPTFYGFVDRPRSIAVQANYRFGE